MNGCAPVVEPILAVMLAMGSGFNTVLVAETLIHLLAMVAALVHRAGQSRLAITKADSEGVVK